MSAVHRCTLGYAECSRDDAVANELSDLEKIQKKLFNLSRRLSCVGGSLNLTRAVRKLRMMMLMIMITGMITVIPRMMMLMIMITGMMFVLRIMMMMVLMVMIAVIVRLRWKSDRRVMRITITSPFAFPSSARHSSIQLPAATPAAEPA